METSKRARVEAASSLWVLPPPVASTQPPRQANPHVHMKTFLQLRWVDFEDLADALPTLMCMFSALEWDSLLSNHRVYYLDLVYEFYENIYLKDEKIFSMVQGR